MFRPIFENSHKICCFLIILFLLCIFIYFLAGILAKRQRLTLKIFLIGKEYFLNIISAIFIFLVFSFPVAMVVWVFIKVLMDCFFRRERMLVNCIKYYENNKKDLKQKEVRFLSQLNPCVTPKYVISWINDVKDVQRRMLQKIDENIRIKSLNIKQKFLLTPIFSTTIIVVFIDLLIYGKLFENYNCFLLLLLENYVILLGVLYTLYWLMYFSIVANVFHIMYGYRRLFKIIFAIFSVIMFIVVTAISFN